MWLSVNAGSVLEDDDQRGIAHFVEHMAFNGTKKYAKQQIVDWLEKIGMKFGADVNRIGARPESGCSALRADDSDLWLAIPALLALWR